MQFYLRESIFSLRQNFMIMDLYNRPWFDCQAEFLSIGHKLHMFSVSNGYEVAYIHQKVLSLMPQYDIWENGQIAANVHKNFTILRDRFQINAYNGQYEIAGDFWGWNYGVWQNGQQIAQISKQLSFLSEHYVVDVADNADIPLVLSLAIIVDEIKEDKGDRGVVNPGFPF